MTGSDLYQKFTAIGEVIDDAPYQVDMGDEFKPFRRNISYFDAKHIDIKPLVLFFERIIQDIGDYCEYIFLSNEGGEDRMQCFEHLQPVFLPNGAIERAYEAYNTRKIL